MWLASRRLATPVISGATAHWAPESANRLLTSCPIVKPGYGWCMVCTLSLPDVLGFLDRNYHNRSAATQIPQNSALAIIPYPSRKFLPPRIELVLDPIVLVKSSRLTPWNRATTGRKISGGMFKLLTLFNLMLYLVKYFLSRCHVSETKSLSRMQRFRFRSPIG